MSDSNSSTKELNESLIVACAEFDLPKVKEVIATGADPNYRRADEDGGLSALHECCMSGPEALEIIQYLLSLTKEGESSVDVNLVDENGIPPIAFAISSQNLEVVKLLHEHGAKFALPEFEAAVAGAIYPDILKYILSTPEGKNSVNAVDPDTGKTPALMAGLAGESAECVRILCAAGADFSTVDRHGKNIFHLAAQNLGAGGDILKFLLSAGGDAGLSIEKIKSSLINQRDSTDVGFTPLLDACATANAEVVEILLSLGADKEISSLPTEDDEEEDDDADEESDEKESKELTCGDVLESYAATADEDDVEAGERVRACLKLLVGKEDE